MKHILSIIIRKISSSTDLFRFYLFFAVLLFAQSFIAFSYIRYISLKEIHRDLEGFTQRVASDLKYQNNKWDTTQYNSDPLTAYPNSSNSHPLYIITTEGFVIERSKPLSGLLDTSDFNHLMQFQSPQFITTVTNEQWRVLSRPIIKDGKTYGVIIVSLYNPPTEVLANVDKQLQESISQLESFISVTNSGIDVTRVDTRNIHYLVSFEVVDRFNRVLANDGRLPTFIDPSYVEKELQQSHSRIVIDQNTKQQYIVFTSRITDSDHDPIAVIVAARSIHSLTSTLHQYLWIAGLLSTFLPIPLSFFAQWYLKKRSDTKAKELFSASQNKKTLTSISFDKKASTFLINNEKIEIAYASNQYYLAKAIFSAPKKRWEQDELIEMMGEKTSLEKFRTVYDAALAINKKLQFKVILHQEKTYFFNPELLSFLK